MITRNRIRIFRHRVPLRAILIILTIVVIASLWPTITSPIAEIRRATGVVALLAATAMILISGSMTRAWIDQLRGEITRLRAEVEIYKSTIIDAEWRHLNRGN